MCIANFFSFFACIDVKIEKMWFFGMSRLIFDEKPLKNHNFWIFVVTENAKIVIFDWFLCKIWFLECCPISFFLKNQFKIEYFIILKLQNWKTLIFQWFFAKNENFYKFTSRWPEKKNSGMVQVVQKYCLTLFFRMPR